MRTQKNHSRLFGTGLGWMVLLCLALLAWTGIATAQLPGVGAPLVFDMTGFIQHAVLDGAGTGALQGGHIKLNGQLITVPSNTIVILPARSLTWAELFTLAPAPYTGVATGMATDDIPAPLGTYEAHVQGNVLTGTANGQGEYVAGVIWISQQGLNHGAGYINFIDYAAGEIFVGGSTADRTTGTRIRLNDPTGQYGRAMTPDQRFGVDPANPTIRSATGFPMCMSRATADPNAGNPDDPLCPQTQRPLCLVGAGPTTTFCGAITTNDPTLGPPAPPSPLFQAPFEVGDYIDFAGTLATDSITNLGPTAGPWPGTANTYISASSIIDNIAIYTWPGTSPAYVAIDVSLLGTGGNTILGAQEASIRTRFEGFGTDPSRVIHVYGMDLACDGSVSGNRDWGMTGIDPGPAKGAIKGRWRFRPPCTATTTTLTEKVCSPPGAGVFLPATREVRAVIEANPADATQVSAWTAGAPICAAGVQPTALAPCNTIAANNLITGQYHLPIADYIWPEQVLGSPIPPANFDTVPFLANGGYSSSSGAPGTVAGQLNPFPFVPVPTSACTSPIPVVTATADVASVTSGGTVTLTATASGNPTSFAWTQTAGTAGTFNAPLPGAASGTWTAPVVTATETATFSVTATNGFGTSAPATVSVTVNPAVPVITSASASPSPANTDATVTLSATATGAAPIAFSWIQTAGPAVTLSLNLDGSAATFTAPAVAASTTLTFNVTATNGGGTSPATTVNAIINPAGTPVVAPIAPQTVFSGVPVTIPITATTTNPLANLTFSVVQGSGPAVVLTQTAPVQTCTANGCTATASVSFTRTLPNGQTTADVLQFSITATDTSVNLTSTAVIAAVTVNPLIPVVNSVSPLTVNSGAAVTMNVSATTPDPAANLTLNVVQTNTPTVALTVTKTGATSWTVTFTAPTLPFGQTTPDVLQFSITATDTTVSLTSATVFTSVTVNPITVAPDSMTVTGAEYRTGKQRLQINITDSVVNPNLVLTLQPYVTQSGTTFNPGAAGKFTNNGGGLYILTLVGAPPPACNAPLGGTQKYATPCTISPAPLDVKSNIGGDSGPFELLKIRQ